MARNLPLPALLAGVAKLTAPLTRLCRESPGFVRPTAPAGVPSDATAVAGRTWRDSARLRDALDQLRQTMVRQQRLLPAPAAAPALPPPAARAAQARRALPPPAPTARSAPSLEATTAARARPRPQPVELPSGGLGFGSLIQGAKTLLGPALAFQREQRHVRRAGGFTRDDPRAQALAQQARELGTQSGFGATQIAAAQAALLQRQVSPAAIQASLGDMVLLAQANGDELVASVSRTSALARNAGVDLAADGAMARFADTLTAERLSAARQASASARAAGLPAASEPRPAPAAIINSAAITNPTANAAPAAAVPDLSGTNLRAARREVDDLSGDLDALQAAWEETSIAFAAANDGALRDLIKGIAEITRGIAGWIDDNPELTTLLGQFLGVLGGILATVGLLASGIGAVLAPLTALSGVLTLLGFNPATLTILAIVAAVAALGVAAYQIYRHWGEISQWFSQRWQQVKDAFAGGIGSVMQLLANWSPLGLIYQGIVATLDKLGIEVPASMSTLSDAIVNGLKSAWKGITELWNWFETAPGRAIDAVVKLVTDWDLMGQLKEKWGAAIGYLKSLPGNLWGSGQEMAGKAADRVTSLASDAGDGLKSLKDKASEGARAVGDRLVAGKNYVVEGASSLAQSALTSFSDILGIQSPSREFAKLGGYTVDGLTLGIERQRDEPIQRMIAIARDIVRAGAGLTLAAAAVPASAQPPFAADFALPGMTPITLDTRAPLTAGGTAAASDNRVQIGDIHIHAAPGMDENALARQVAQEVQRALEQAQRERAAYQRSSMWDRD
ncbi:phage tail tape measure protein [Salinicola sp. DM10]|uniref:phage tail tape measure protein n=1 Tax=Salinicola sp. DM10 TaxID=2815721 RepID=UPI001A8FCE27|nr:phage tail tape measure protein [Salinicola sp. DM10]MCE3028580.1 phage tail tape measure protein [Salinicola sp. DM10]